MAKKKNKTVKGKNGKPSISVEERARQKSRIILSIIAVGVIAAGSFLFYTNFIAGRIGGFGSYQGFNVLLVTIDTLRADHLSAYGYTSGSTPNLDRMAKESLVFQDAIAHVPMTLPSHASILTGLLPMSHGVKDNSFFSLDQKLTTLAEILKQNGYHTGAFVSSVVLHSSRQLNQGFDVYSEEFEPSEEKTLPSQQAERPAGETEKVFEGWIDQNANKRFFAWIHFYDPHDPYEPPEPYKTRFATQPYDGEIAYTDEVFGTLIAKLEALEIKDRTLIVVTGDHGESLGEHQEMTHGIFLYDSTLHVPLLIRLPGLRRRDIAPVVSHVDLAPTILEWVGIKPFQEMQGRSLIPLLEGKEKLEREVYSESTYAKIHYGWSPLESMTTHQYKYISAPKSELYERQEDRKENQNLIQQKGPIAKALSSRLQEIVEKYTRKDLETFKAMDPETEEKLRALGYISSQAQSTPQSRSIDPKDKIHLHLSLGEAYEATRKKQNQRVLEILAPVIQESPDMIEAHYLAGLALAELQQYPQAIDQFLKTLALRPDYTMAMYNLAVAYQTVGNTPEAESWLKKLLEQDPTHPTANAKLAQIYFQAQKPEAAKPYYEKAVSLYKETLDRAGTSEGRSTALANLAEIYFSAGQLMLGEQSLRLAIQATPRRPSLHYNLAQLQEAKGNVPDAVLEYRQEIQIDPSNFMAIQNLGLLYRRMNQLDDAADCFQKVLELRPGDIQASYLLAETYLMSGTRLETALQLAQSVSQRRPDLKQARDLAGAISAKLRTQRPQ